jgi:hypothetical protein
MATPKLSQITGSRGASFSLPPFDSISYTYVASGAADDDDVATQVFKVGGASGTTVATLTYTYVGSTNNIATAVLTVP